MFERTDELIERLSAVDARHDARIRRAGMMMGRALAVMGRYRPTRWLLANVLSRMSAWFVVERLGGGCARARNGDLLDVTEAWLDLPLLFRLPFRVAEASDEKVIVAWDACPLGFTEGMIETCEASTAIDRETVKRLGAKLEVTENILRGAPSCLFVITRD